MTTNLEQEYELFLENLLTAVNERYRETPQYRQEQQLREQIDKEMENMICEDERPVVEDWIYNLMLGEEEKQSYIYRQGMLDSVFLLRSLGVLA